MRFFFLALPLVALTSFLLPQQARAQSFGDVNTEVLRFISDTPIVRGGEQMSLCTLSWVQRMGPVPVVYEVQRYVLAADGCKTDWYYDVPDDFIDQAIASGSIDPDTPREPSLTMDQLLITVGSLGALAVTVIGGILFALYKALGGGTRRKQRRVNPELNEAALAAMCTVARADGEIDMQEANVVAAVSGEILGFQPKLQSILEMLHHAPSNYNEINFVAFGQGFTEKEKRVIMRGALRTATADGKICEAEHRVINGLAGGLMISGDEVRQMIHDLSKPKNIRRAGAKNPNRYLAYEGRYENADGNFSAARETGGLFAGIWSTIKSLRSLGDDFF